jgi:hypothetical protein
VPPGDASQIYSHFLDHAAVSKRAWCLSCHHGELVAVHGSSHHLIFSLWADLDSAEYFIAQHWPDLKPSELSLFQLLWRCLPALTQEDIPVGIGLAPYSEAVVVPAERLRRDLIRRRMFDTDSPALRLRPGVTRPG